MNLGQERLNAQRLTREKFSQVEDVVRWMGAMQAQDYHQALWAIGTRMQQATVSGIEQAIAAKQIIRTWPMRGTIHFVAPENVRWMLDILASRVVASGGRRWQQLELSMEDFAACRDYFYEALEGGKMLSRPDAMQMLESHGISTRGARGYHILVYLAQTGVLCMGPMAGKQQTFVLLDEWVPAQASKDLTRDAALAELAALYFRSHGPATVHDLAWWAGITLTDARAGLEAVKKSLVCSVVDGVEYWQHPDATKGDHDDPVVGLLAGYDEFFLGYKDRSMIVEADNAQRVVPGNNGVFYPMVMVNGQIVGTWKRTLKKSSVAVSIELFGTATHGHADALRAHASAYADFLGLSLSGVDIQ